MDLGICANDCMLPVGQIFEVSFKPKNPYYHSSKQYANYILTTSYSGSALLNTPRVSLALLFRHTTRLYA